MSDPLKSTDVTKTPAPHTTTPATHTPSRVEPHVASQQSSVGSTNPTKTSDGGAAHPITKTDADATVIDRNLATRDARVSNGQKLQNIERILRDKGMDSASTLQALQLIKAELDW